MKQQTAQEKILQLLKTGEPFAGGYKPTYSIEEMKETMLEAITWAIKECVVEVEDNVDPDNYHWVMGQLYYRSSAIDKAQLLGLDIK